MTTKRQGAIYTIFVAPTMHLVHQLPRALIVSVLAAALDVIVLMSLVQWLRWSPLHANVVSYTLGGVLQYVLSSYWVFPQAPRRIFTHLLVFFLLSLVGLGLSSGVIGVFSLFGWQTGLLLLCAKIASQGVSFVWNFGSRRYFIFRQDFLRKPVQSSSEIDVERGLNVP